MNWRLRYGLMIAAGFAALGLAAPFLLPATFYKAEIERRVTQATGRKLTISGPIHFTLLPSPGLRADTVALANVPDGRAAMLATAADVRIAVRFWPLLQGRVEVSEIVLDRPQINLEIDPMGRANWTLERPARDGARRSQHFSISARFSGLRIADGHVAYSNRRTGHAFAIDRLDAMIAFPDADRSALAQGSFGYVGQRVEFKARVAAPRDVLDGKAARLDVSLQSEFLQSTYAGALSANGEADGTIAIDTTALRPAASWLKIRLPNSAGWNTLSLRGRIASRGHATALRDLHMTLDAMHIGGNVEIDGGGGRPALRGMLAVDDLDLNPYIRHPARPGMPRPHHSNEEWSGDPINLDVLKIVDADLALNARRLEVGKLTLGATAIKASLRDGRLTARMDPIALYGGKGAATLDVDARGALPAFKSRFRFDNVALQPFLAASIGVKQIEGTGTIALDVASAGDNVSAIMHDISGKGSIAFRDGRLRGVDLGAVARTIASLLGNSAALDAVTQYRAMNASFDISRGVLVNRDFQLDGPELSMTGSGNVDVGNRTIDFRIAPRVKASAGQHKLAIGVPFRIKGSWRHLRYTADMSGVVKGVFENLKAGRAPLKGLFGSTPENASGKKKKHKNLGDALKNMLGIH